MVEESQIEEFPEVVSILDEHQNINKRSLSPEPKKYSNKRMKLTVAKEDLIKSKAKVIDLDNNTNNF